MLPRHVANRSGASIRLSAGVMSTTIHKACSVVRVDHVSVPEAPWPNIESWSKVDQSVDVRPVPGFER